jgi:hypothetical protein
LQLCAQRRTILALSCHGRFAAFPPASPFLTSPNLFLPFLPLDTSSPPPTLQATAAQIDAAAFGVFESEDVGGFSAEILNLL